MTRIRASSSASRTAIGFALVRSSATRSTPNGSSLDTWYSHEVERGSRRMAGRVTIRRLTVPCLACNRQPGSVMCDLCSRLVDAERDAYPRPTLTLVDVTPPERKDAPR